MTEEVRQSEETQRNCETARHRLETELRDMAVRLEQTEHVTLREGKRIVAKLQNRVRHLANDTCIGSIFTARRTAETCYGCALCSKWPILFLRRAVMHKVCCCRRGTARRYVCIHF